MTALYPTLKPRAGESPASLVSRLALLHRLQSVRVFALDMGFQQQNIVDGDPEALARLAGLVSVSPDEISHWAIARHGDHYKYRGQTFSRSSLRRARQMACPRCLAEDLEAGPTWNVSARADWLFQHSRICMVHHVELVCVAHADDPSLVHDFARSAAAAIPLMPQLAAEAINREPTRLEHYVHHRLDGRAGSPWLDSLPCYVAIRTCEVVGAVIQKGRDVSLKELSDEDWRSAGEAGFDLASGGPERVRELLHDLWTAHVGSHEHSAGPQAWFGRLFKWLYSLREDPHYDCIRNLIINFVADTSPVSPEDLLFGKQIVTERRLHSVSTASSATGLHRKRLRRVLRASGILSATSDHLTDNVATFSSEAAAPVFDKLQNALTQKQVETNLNSGRVHTKLLVDHGFIQPMEDHDRLELGDQCYDRRELDEFKMRLFTNVVWVKEPEWPQMTIAAAAKRTCCSAMEIVRLILDRRLRWVGSWTATTGFLSLLVDATEVKRLIRSEDSDHLTMGQAADMLGTTDRVLSALVESKVLSSERRISPKNRCPYVAIPRKAAEAFKAQFASLHELARGRSKHMPILKRELASRGIEPALTHKQVMASFYRRSEIPPDL